MQLLLIDSIIYFIKTFETEKAMNLNGKVEILH